MSEYNFKKFIPRYSTLGNFIYLNKTNVNVSKRADDHLGNPKSVDVFYDLENKAIKLESSSDGVKVTRRGSSSIFSGGICKIMPLGRYRWEKDNIYKLEE